jgi:hypothetical protein
MHDHLIDALRRAPALVAGAVASVPSGAAAARTGDEWSVAEIVGHIRAADTIWRTRAVLALVHDGVTMPDVDERALQAVQEASGLTLDDQVRVFTVQRHEIVGILSSLSEHDWARTCVHSTAGLLTMVDVCRAWEEHEREHLVQLQETVGRLAQ